MGGGAEQAHDFAAVNLTGGASLGATLVLSGHEQLALQACHPRFFATQRYIAYAKAVSVSPPGGGKTTPLEAAG